VETAARTVGTVAKVASMIPGLGGLATAAGAVTDAVAGVASMFGWSKPTDPEYPTKVEIGYAKYTANANGDSKPKGLGFDSRTAVTLPTCLANVDEDEMAIQTIVSRPVYYTRFGFDKTQVPGTLLFSTPVCPTACTKANFTSGTIVGTTFFNTFLSFLSPLFVCYRGALKYTLRLVKTPFHSGRIMVTYVPGADLTTNFATTDLSKCYRQIYDLRHTTVIEFEVPFIHNAPFKSIRATIDALNPTKLAYTVPTGMVYVSVINALRNPATTADSIDIIVEVCGGKDFQFAGPVFASAIGSSPPRTLSIVRGSEVDTPIVYSGHAQSNEIAPLSSTTLFDMNEHGIGEVVESLRSLLKRYTDYTATYANPIRVFNPTWAETSPSQPGLLNQNIDMYTWIGQLYRFMSGGMRIATLLKKDSLGYRFAITPIGLGSLDADQTLSTLQRGNIYQFPTVEPFMEIGVPFYQRTPAILTDVGGPKDASADTNASDYSSMPHNTGTTVSVYPIENDDILGGDDLRASMRLLRSIGEDFSFFYLLGPPITGAYLPAPPP
jgi:hypothetical protein